MLEENHYSTAVEVHLFSALLLKFFNQDLEIRLRNYGVKISSLQHGILRMLQFETLTVSEISQRFGLDPSTVVRSIDSLEKKELVKRGSDANDRRRNPIMLASKGRELVNAVPVISKEDKTFHTFQTMDIDSAHHLRDLLRELITKFPEGLMVAGLMDSKVNYQKKNKP